MKTSLLEVIRALGKILNPPKSHFDYFQKMYQKRWKMYSTIIEKAQNKILKDHNKKFVNIRQNLTPKRSPSYISGSKNAPSWIISSILISLLNNLLNISHFALKC